MGIPRNSRICEVQRNNVTTKQHQEILPIQTDNILNRCHNKIKNKKVILARRIFMEKLNPVRRQFPCNNFFSMNNEYDIHNKKMKNIKKNNYIQRNLDDKPSARH